MKDPFTISLFAQRHFNHELLLALVRSGALSQTDAAAIAGKVANNIGQLKIDQRSEAFALKLAEGFEQIAAAILGLPPVGPRT
jgi:hypothetical protein